MAGSAVIVAALILALMGAMFAMAHLFLAPALAKVAGPVGTVIAYVVATIAIVFIGIVGLKALR